jgi:heterodisulfide reductase subunit A
VTEVKAEAKEKVASVGPGGIEISEPRIGVFPCYCGSNIAGTVDVEAVAAYARTLPDVVWVQTNKYTCADVGQAEIRKAIKDHNLNRVVVASCSPRMHEPTFRKCVQDAGLNPFLFEMANIREFCSWIHYANKEEATEKAKDYVRMAVAKARYLQPLEPFYVPITKKALVIGGGVAGIHAALDIADHGYKVYLVEKEPSIGGRMAQLDKTFPTLDCSICIEGPKMVEAGRHPNIELLAYSEVKKVSGFIGNFKVQVLKKAKYVRKEKCTGCGDCAKACPVEVPNEYDVNLGPRKAIYIPLPQAVPNTYTIDMKHCIKCFKCVEACGDRMAIDFTMQDEIVELEVGAIVVATGYSMWDATQKVEYGYGRYENVVTSLELERLICASGPLEGHVVRASDGKEPKKVAFITCVGSREMDPKGIAKPYCSNFCCMFTLKLANLWKDHWPDAELYIIYMDMRTIFKGFEDFYIKARDLGITFIRGRPSEIIELPNKNLLIKVFDTFINQPVELEVEMVVLAEASVPNPDSRELAAILNVPVDEHGFFIESHPKLKPIDFATDGVFLAGCCQGLKDIPYSVSQAHGAASRATRVLSQDKWKIDPIVAVVDDKLCIGCGMCVERCAYKAISLIEVPGREKKLAKINPAQCHGCGTCVADCPSNAMQQMHFTDAQIMAQIREATARNPEQIIIAMICNWCTYGAADLAGVSRIQQPTSARVIRVMCSGRVDRDFIYEAFRRGAGAFFMGGCEIGTCHYVSGNKISGPRFDKIKEELVKQGLTPERMQRRWISAAMSTVYANTIKELDRVIKELGVERIKAENEKLRPYLEKRLGLVPKEVPPPVEKFFPAKGIVESLEKMGLALEISDGKLKIVPLAEAKTKYDRDQVPMKEFLALLKPVGLGISKKPDGTVEVVKLAAKK